MHIQKIFPEHQNFRNCTLQFLSARKACVCMSLRVLQSFRRSWDLPVITTESRKPTITTTVSDAVCLSPAFLSSCFCPFVAHSLDSTPSFLSHPAPGSARSWLGHLCQLLHAAEHGGCQQRGHWGYRPTFTSNSFIHSSDNEKFKLQETVEHLIIIWISALPEGSTTAHSKNNRSSPAFAHP